MSLVKKSLNKANIEVRDLWVHKIDSPWRIRYMLDVAHKHKGANMFFAAFRSNSGHLIYLSAYGHLASALSEKYVESQRDDNEELFAEWDKSVEKASSQTGFSASHAVEDGYVYISTFQSGIGISAEDEMGSKKPGARRTN